MARLGLGAGWSCVLANDHDPAKAATYLANFPDAEDHFRAGDIQALTLADLPGRADLVWASSPCQDFSLAGDRAGLAGGRSGALVGVLQLVAGLVAEDRAPALMVIENVSGLLTARGGEDVRALFFALKAAGYHFGALEIDAAHFLPQSRPRIFVIASRRPPKAGLTGASPFQTPAICRLRARLPPDLAPFWIDWALAAPPPRQSGLADLLEPDDQLVWHDPARTLALLDLMSPRQRARIAALQGLGARTVGGLFLRTRTEAGQRRQRAEARFDGLAGCLRTPGGGSSRQMLILIEAGQVRTRLITPREAARLMGVAETYCLPKGRSAGLHLAGDGVVVPVVRWLSAQILEPLLAQAGPAL